MVIIIQINKKCYITLTTVSKMYSMKSIHAKVFINLKFYKELNLKYFISFEVKKSYLLILNKDKFHRYKQEKTIIK